jgi:thymidylate synthase (FAD)
MGICEMKVELVAWTQGMPDDSMTGRGDILEPILRPGIKPIEVVGRAGGICWDKEEKEDYESFVRRVIKMGHESVIEHASFTFRVEGVSRALTHQWVRHRLCSFSQRSQRYVKENEVNYVMPPMEYLDGKPSKTHWVPKDARDRARRKIEDAMNDAWNYYNELINLGVRGEDARFVLPNACETKMVWTSNARELRHFFKLRMDKHAQWEIRKMAQLMFDEVMKVAPVFFEDLKPLRGDINGS